MHGPPERLIALPDVVWSPLTTGVQILAAGGFGLLAGAPWLFASLGPTAFMHAEVPHHRSSRFYNTVVGHMIGMGAGFCGIWIFNAWSAPAVDSTRHITGVRVWAAVVAIALMALVALMLKASHPPAAATALLISLGAMQQARDALSIFAGVIIVAIIGEGFRRLRELRQDRTGQPFATHPPAARAAWDPDALSPLEGL